MPAERADQFEVGQTAVPASKTDVRRGKTSFLGSVKHGPEVVIICQVIRGRIKEAIIAWDSVGTVTPHEDHQVDPSHNAAVFARPVSPHQPYFPRIGFIQGGIR